MIILFKGLSFEKGIYNVSKHISFIYLLTDPIVHVIPNSNNVIPAGEPGSPYVVLGLPTNNVWRSRIYHPKLITLSMTKSIG